jgi:hypothetical protein
MYSEKVVPVPITHEAYQVSAANIVNLAESITMRLTSLGITARVDDRRLIVNLPLGIAVAEYGDWVLIRDGVRPIEVFGNAAYREMYVPEDTAVLIGDGEETPAGASLLGISRDDLDDLVATGRVRVLLAGGMVIAEILDIEFGGYAEDGDASWLIKRDPARHGNFANPPGIDTLYVRESAIIGIEVIA